MFDNPPTTRGEQRLKDKDTMSLDFSQKGALDNTCCISAYVMFSMKLKCAESKCFLGLFL